MSVEHPPQHAPCDGGVDPEQPETMVVVFDFVHHALAQCAAGGPQLCGGAVDRTPLLQLLVVFLQRAETLLHLGIIQTPPAGVEPADAYPPLSCWEGGVGQSPAPQDQGGGEAEGVKAGPGAGRAVCPGEEVERSLDQGNGRNPVQPAGQTALMSI